MDSRLTVADTGQTHTRSMHIDIQRHDWRENDGVECRSRPGRGHAVGDAEGTGETESDELKGSGKKSVGFIE